MLVSFRPAVLGLAVMSAVTLAAVAPCSAAPMEMQSQAHGPMVARLVLLKLDDGGRAFIGRDHKLYLLDANGTSRLAPPGHYHTEDGACFGVAVGADVDPAALRSYLSAHPGAQLP